MTEHPDHSATPVRAEDRFSEGGLRPPPGFSFWRKAWWWFDFLFLVKIARLRFIAILILLGLLIVYWDNLAAHFDKWTRPAGAEHAQSTDSEYFCPMHPTVVRDDPHDKCPICYMPLSKRKRGEGTGEALPPGVVNRVQLSPYRVVLAGVRTWTVDYVPLDKKITTVGYVEFNEREVKQVSARVKGRLDKLYVGETGQMVHAGEELALLYSPDLSVTIQNLLDAKRAGNAQLLDIAKERLILWGIDEGQINDILRTGKATDRLKIPSPITGHVIKKYVKEGQYVEEGTPLYEVADLSTVWIQAQVFEDDIPFLPPDRQFHDRNRDRKNDLPITATTQATSTERFPGTLTFVHPHVDQDTRTVTVRYQLDNPGHKLRPGTSASVELRVPPRQVPLFARRAMEQGLQERIVESLLLPEGLGLLSLLCGAERHALLQQGLVLAVPEGAVIDTGSQQIVYREVAPGEYEGVKVELGPRMVDATGVPFYPVFDGVEAGDRIVTAGSFLVDAETRLNPAAGSIYFGGTGLNKPGQMSSVRPSTPEDEDAKVKANLARRPTKMDRDLAAAQGYCPINPDTRLGSMGAPVKVMLKGKPVFLC